MQGHEGITGIHPDRTAAAGHRLLSIAAIGAEASMANPRPPVASPAKLRRDFKEAAPALGISRRIVHLVDYLLDHVHNRDWGDEIGPVVWPSNRLIGEYCGIGPTQVKALIRAVRESGLVVMRDSPDRKRSGRRAADGRLIYAYGFDLSPLAARGEEFAEIVAKERRRRVDEGALRRRRSIARIRIVQLLAVPELAGYQQLARLAALAQRPRRGRVGDNAETMRREIADLQTAAEEAQAWLLATAAPVDKGRQGADFRPPEYSYNSDRESVKDSVAAPEQGGAAAGGREPAIPALQSSDRPANQADAPVGGLHRGAEESGVSIPNEAETITPSELVRLAPMLRSYLVNKEPSWRDIVDAADWLRHDFGVGKALWGDACRAIGRERAAIAMAIVSTKPRGHFRSSPGGYFAAMIQRAREGRLALDRSVWALRKTGERR